MSDTNKTITVMGIGYVGLPLACLAASKGYRVYGLDINQKLVDAVNNKTPRLEDVIVERTIKDIVPDKLSATTDPSCLKESEIVIICVPTPVDKKYQPDFGPLLGACDMIAKNPRAGQLVVVESTINPGVCEEIVIPFFKQFNLEEGKDYFLAHAPERINPGDPEKNVEVLPRNVGAFNEEGLKRTKEFYESIINAPINPMKSAREAEATKTIENAFRDVNIAFINEIAKSFDQLGIDVIDVIKGASSKFSFMAHWPGCGVGGHCIPVDPYYLIQKAADVGFSHDFLKLARTINNGMPHYAVELLQDELNKLKMAVKGTKIAVLGVSYKANVADTRESPAFVIIEKLKEMGAEVLVFDPLLPEDHSILTDTNLESVLQKADALFVAIDHNSFKENLTVENLQKYPNIKAILDGKNCLDKEAIIKSGIAYKGIGH